MLHIGRGGASESGNYEICADVDICAMARQDLRMPLTIEAQGATLILSGCHIQIIIDQVLAAFLQISAVRPTGPALWGLYHG